MKRKVKSWGLYRNRLQKPKNGAGEAMQPPKTSFSKKKSTVLPTKYSAFLVENSGIEPRYTRYEINQMQRARERNVRRWKKRYLAETEAGVDTTALTKATVYEKIVDARTQLSNTYVPTGGRPQGRTA